MSVISNLSYGRSSWKWRKWRQRRNVAACDIIKNIVRQGNGTSFHKLTVDCPNLFCFLFHLLFEFFNFL